MAAEAAEIEKAREVLKSYLSQRLRVEVSDGRIVEGIFMCTDRDRNIVLSNCEEFYGRQELGKLSRDWIHGSRARILGRLQSG